MLTCRDQQAAAYKGSRKINRPATHPIHFAADSPDKIHRYAAWAVFFF